MSDVPSASAIAARLKGLRDAMDKVMAGSTPDHGKWVGVTAFIRAYVPLANACAALTKERHITIYDLSKLRSHMDMVWPQQKALFDSLYMNTLSLINLVENHISTPELPMYNLIISAQENSWSGDPFQLELDRCVREYTDENITRKYASLSPELVKEIKRFPTIFAYEKGCDRDPKFGYITDIVTRQGKVRIEYRILEVGNFLSWKNLEELSFELDIGKLELYRTHWSIKPVDLAKELHAKGIKIGDRFTDVRNSVDISSHVFDVALSFPGESRPLVEEISKELERILGPNRYFYDNNYRAQLAQPSLDTLLQGVYKRAKIDVVFIGADYQKKDWCGVEFRVIREIIMEREYNRVMFVRVDDGAVDGVFKTDGYLDARKSNPLQIAEFIKQRIELLSQIPSDVPPAEAG